MSKQTDLINIPDAITVDGSNNVGIGTSSPDNNTNYTALTVKSTSGSGGGQVYVESSGAKGVFGADNAGSGAKVILYTINADDPLLFGTSNTERMRIDSSGNLLVANTTGSSSDTGHIFAPTGIAFHVRDGGIPLVAVSYTHLTLPTKRIV